MSALLQSLSASVIVPLSARKVSGTILKKLLPVYSGNRWVNNLRRRLKILAEKWF
jgi:hypothetical protein